MNKTAIMITFYLVGWIFNDQSYQHILECSCQPHPDTVSRKSLINIIECFDPEQYVKTRAFSKTFYLYIIRLLMLYYIYFVWLYNVHSY